ncbi:hypothetical protein EYF80_045153 [Liparis tanakae]|uniref:Uncharacterized protein n=1 Tax=Liparis tanakae TaxID=230148 RepID=A0A4Z2FVF0_9TELE|nr:hypothetical protein EYF80_045153 [Liparis tanakae]
MPNEKSAEICKESRSSGGGSGCGSVVPSWILRSLCGEKAPRLRLRAPAAADPWRSLSGCKVAVGRRRPTTSCYITPESAAGADRGGPGRSGEI